MGTRAWYVRDGGSAIGPVATETLIEQVKRREISISAEVCALGDSTWTPLAAQPAFMPVVRELAPPPVAPAAVHPKPSSALGDVSRGAVFAGAIVVAVALLSLVGYQLFAAHRRAQAEARRKADPLYIPCVGKLTSELLASLGAGASQNFRCGAGTMSAGVIGGKLLITYHDTTRPGLPAAATVKSYVTAVLPNLRNPSKSAAFPCRHVMQLDLATQDSADGKLALAAGFYKTAEGVVETIEKWGGHRYATWMVSGGTTVVAENAPGDGDPVAITITTGPASEAPPNLSDAPWDDSATCPRKDSPQLATLRSKMMADGWWFDDAAAFMEAANAAGGHDDTDTADEMYLVARMLTATRDNWDEIQRAIVARKCMAPAIKGAAKGLSAPFDTASGIDEGFNWVIAPPAPEGEGALFVDESGAARETKRFDAMVHTAIHAKCVLDYVREVQHAGNAVQVLGFDRFWRDDKVPAATWKRAWAIASQPRFVRALFSALARARASLVESAQQGNATAPTPTPTGAAAPSNAPGTAASSPNANGGG
jgi:hypothetical protein